MALFALLKRLAKQLKDPWVWGPVIAILVVVLLALIGFWWWRNWFVAVIAALAIALTVLTVVLLRMALTKDQEDQLERGLDDREEAVSSARVETPAASELGERFARALRDIKTSKLGVYELPWLLVLGESGAGKSALVREAGLDIPAEFAGRVPEGPTQTCDWWLSNHAIVMDTPGRYVDSEDEAALAEWRYLLRSLKKYRSGSPLDGLIITLPAPSLLGLAQPELDARARTLRRRVNELDDVLGVAVPIYLVITKADWIEGFVETANALGAAHHRQAIGWTNSQDEQVDMAARALAGLAEVRERFEAVLGDLLLRSPDVEQARKVFRFPQEFGVAVDVVARFVGGMFAPSRYDEVPFLRGVYFTSARREGRTVSPLLAEKGAAWALGGAQIASTPGAVFTHDLVHEIILGDRNLAIPRAGVSPRARMWAHGLSAAVLLALSAWWGTAFAAHVGLLSDLARDAETIAVRGARSLPRLDDLRRSTLAAEEQQANGSTAGLGGNLERGIERARRVFNDAFGRAYEQPTKDRLLSSVRDSDHDDAFEALVRLAQDVGWLETRANSTGPGDAVRPALIRYAPRLKEGAEQKAFVDGYDDFVRWSSDVELASRIKEQRSGVSEAAPRLLNLRRLEAWSRRSPGSYPPIGYAELGLTEPDGAEPVPGVYTQSGWEKLVFPMIAAIRDAEGTSVSAIERFEREYVDRYDALWRGYLMGVPLVPLSERRPLRSPYIKAIETLRQQSAVAGLPREARPQWLALLGLPGPEEAKEGEADEEWPRYTSALTLLDADLAPKLENPKQALRSARDIAEGKGPFPEALRVVRETVPASRDVEAAEQIERILSMPVLNAASALLDRATDDLERRFDEAIGAEFVGELSPQKMEELYDLQTGALTHFIKQDLAGLYEGGEAVEVVGDRRLPLGDEFLAWLEAAERLQTQLDHGKLTLHLAGIPTRIESSPGATSQLGSQARISHRRIRLECDAGAQQLDYYEGTWRDDLHWTPDCTELSLRIWIQDGGAERELRPRKRWSGTLALPRFLQEARVRSGRFEWVLGYEEPPVDIVAAYRLRGAEEVLELTHSSPPQSLRD